MNGPNEWKKKPDTVMAMRYIDEKSAYDIMEWAHSGLHPAANSVIRLDGNPKCIMVRTAFGEAYAGIGSWVLRTPEGAWMVMNDEAFRAVYEPNFIGSAVPPSQR